MFNLTEVNNTKYLLFGCDVHSTRLQKAMVSRSGPKGEMILQICDITKTGMRKLRSIFCALYKCRLYNWYETPKHVGRPRIYHERYSGLRQNRPPSWPFEPRSEKRPRGTSWRHLFLMKKKILLLAVQRLSMGNVMMRAEKVLLAQTAMTAAQVKWRRHWWRRTWI